ncbi:TrbG/VirB9 family P-type conjugative transfer protein [Sphingobium sp. BYY-5]|uniref:TrbG/VirB9 family P-type conjugative transfer protein n=1 Tax=Sphingobium sp. BYY-5 TaxID=2926400 RepID=UPI001FA6C2F9|nr:TrbG/VirB9 family P-type conjugative transfer protein [Sphingobium sp. BYY-5]MCI4590578.1 TrbG/VirB9 family P-type conjugative transfer protein [Sphingobium sp. BYY-5]
MKPLRILAVLAMISVAPAHAQDGLADPRVRTIDYHPDQVFRIECAAGYQLMIEFAADERITSVAVGDSGVWQVAANRAGNQLVVKAAQGGVTTNMTVATTERSYHFDLVPSYAPTLYRLRFNYPRPPATVGSVPVGLTHGYRLSGARSLWPVRIGDDGERTFVEWARDVSLPAVYAVDAQGRETLVNGMMRDDRLVIDAIATQLVFRIDKHVARARRLTLPDSLPKEQP